MDLDPRLKAYHQKIQELESKDELLQIVDVLKAAIALSLELYGENHEETLALYTEYGGLLRNLGRYEESLEILHKSIQISLRLRGANHPDYASSLVNLANLLRMMKHFSESETLFLQAKSIYERTIGTNHFIYAGMCNNLGLLYQEMGRYTESIPLHLISLRILRPDQNREILYAVTLNNLVEPYRHTNQKEKAITTLKEAIAIFEKYIYRAPVFYAAAVNNLGTIYFEEKRYEEAKKCFETAVDISEKKLGMQSESYINSIENLRRVNEKLHIDTPTSTVPSDIVAYMQSLKKTNQSTDGITYMQPSMANDTFSEGSHNYHITEVSKGLEISEAYFFDVCYPALKKEMPEYLPRMAAGLIGEGSECYGFDDMISRDHDFGPSFQIYVPAEDVPVYGKQLRALVDRLPKEYACFDGRKESTYGGGRIGLFTIEDFYDKFLSIHEVPTSNNIWLQMKDYPLSTVTNGKVFMDNLGTFSKIRDGLLKHYPRDVQLKKMAAECMQIAQSGQYNFSRSLQRQQYVAAHHALDQFIEHYSSIIYLLNKVYKPYYKWEHEGLKKLPVLGIRTHQSMAKIALMDYKEQPNHVIFEIESLCRQLIQVLHARGLSSSNSDFLLDHGPELLKRIEDPALQHSNPWN